MAYENLSDFLNELQDDGELIRISTEVDPVLEITEITDRVSKSPLGGPALFFENVKGSSSRTGKGYAMIASFFGDPGPTEDLKIVNCRIHYTYSPPSQ